MESKEIKEEQSCCDSGCCGGKCCCAKALMALVLLLIGGIIGYLMGGHCRGGKMWNCPMSGISTPMTPPPAK